MDVAPSPKRSKSAPSCSAGVVAEETSDDLFASTFVELDATLTRASQLSLEFPTTSSWLSFISRI